MADWPSIATAQYGSSNVVTKPAVRSRSEAGYAQTRARMTLAKEKKSLTWNYLSNADYETLMTFFNTNSGGSFNYTDPITSETKEYTFSDDELEFSQVTYGYLSGTVNIEEI